MYETKKELNNLAAYSSFKTENPHQDKLENQINEHFPLETLDLLALKDDSLPWFTDFANYHAGNLYQGNDIPTKKINSSRMSSQYFWDEPLSVFKTVSDQAYENSLSIKRKPIGYTELKIKNRVFNLVIVSLLFNSRQRFSLGRNENPLEWTISPLSKLFLMARDDYSQNSGPNFKVNGHRIKHYFGGDIPTEVVPDLQTFPMDQ
ncbi:hypothetical protein Tco_0226874 [Tanacetum coccineum]